MNDDDQSSSGSIFSIDDASEKWCPFYQDGWRPFSGNFIIYKWANNRRRLSVLKIYRAFW